MIMRIYEFMRMQQIPFDFSRHSHVLTVSHRILLTEYWERLNIYAGGMRHSHPILLIGSKIVTEPMNHYRTGEIVEKELSYRLVGLFFYVQKKLGRYCRERQYADALEKELENEHIKFVREFPIVTVDDRVSNTVDFCIEHRVLVDLKAKPFIEKSDYYQMKRYLESGNFKLGLIVNFRNRYLYPKRVLNPKYSKHSNEFVVKH